MVSIRRKTLSDLASNTPMPNTPLTTKSKQRKLTPLQRRRKIALLDAGITAADVARAAGVRRPMVSQLIYGAARSARVEAVFAQLTNKRVEELFPPTA